MTIQQTRKDHLKSLWAEGLWGKWVGLAWFVLTAFPFFRDEFWRPSDENRWKLINLVPHWSLPMWSAVTLALLLAWVYRGLLSLVDQRQSPFVDLRSAIAHRNHLRYDQSPAPLLGA
ncbi:MAG: hypothetical protein CPDRYMAC_5883 [uncultured Paraburkholderia sp.]|nr:MAG: hypothetical protein CPDRYDRY_5830 [uncultured Paraburkholderia sp.]CAH2942792.1 MAG: hypothetical protein CPDRYMAC_5883 [uncultured Paraburkholderia sp.]